MSLSSAVLLIAIVGLMATGQLLFKLVGNTVSENGLLSMVGNPLFWLSAGLYAATTILWIVLLSREDISRAYPATALVYVIVPVAGALIFHERLSPLFFAGLALVLCGVALVLASSSGPAPQ
jgi:drug/metabolite transporter (DMT)-like permease